MRGAAAAGTLSDVPTALQARAKIRLETRAKSLKVRPGRVFDVNGKQGRPAVCGDKEPVGVLLASAPVGSGMWY